MAADYSQIELRILAHLSGRAGASSSRSGAARTSTRARRARCSRCAPDTVTSLQRTIAKSANYAILYGVSAFGLSQATKIDQKEAQRYISAYFASPSARARLHRPHAGRGARARLRDDAARPAPLPAGPALRQPGRPQRRRAHGHERAGAGDGQRHDQDRHGAHARGAARARAAGRACCCRCTTSCSSRRRPTRSTRWRPWPARSWRRPCRSRCPIVVDVKTGDDWSRGVSAARKFLLVGLTGGIATGKSTVSSMLRGARRRRSSTPTARPRGGRAGPARAGRDRRGIRSRRPRAPTALDRKKLGAIVFADPERRKRLEAITHPAHSRRASWRGSTSWPRGASRASSFYDAAVLIEARGHQDMDRLVVVVTDEATQAARLRGRDGIGRRRGPAEDRQPDAAGREGQARRLRDRQFRRPRGHRRASPATSSRPSRASSRRARRRSRRRSRPRDARVPPENKRRALGQHFLRDGGIARAIVDLVAPTPADLVVEIGPGDGALTGSLARPRRPGRSRSRSTAALGAALARGSRRSRSWRRTRERGTTARWCAPAGGRVLVVGNLPYSVGKPILAALVGAGGAIDAMALMLQREVAERVAAPPGGKTYGSLSVLTQLHCDVGWRFGCRRAPFARRPRWSRPCSTCASCARRACRWPTSGASRRSCGRRSPSDGRRWRTRSAPGSVCPLEVVRRAASGLPGSTLGGEPRR